MYKTRNEVENWLKEMEITNYIINADLTVDVNGSVNISSCELNEIPIQFGVVNGSFDCYNNRLTSLAGCPEVVNGGFNCYNNRLTSLAECPEVVNGSFSCNCNELTSLEGFPQKVDGFFVFFETNKIEEEELGNFNCNIKNVKEIYSDFNEDGDKKDFLKKVDFHKMKKENELLRELSINSNNVKLNKKL